MLGSGFTLELGMSVSPSPHYMLCSAGSRPFCLSTTTLFLVSFDMLCLWIKQLVTCSVNIQEGAMTPPQRRHGDGSTGVSKEMEAREVVGSAGR